MLILIISNIITVPHMHTPTVFSTEVQAQHLLISPFCVVKKLLFDIPYSLPFVSALIS